jgi:hypothetical protein
MDSEHKRFIYRYCGIAAIASISLGFVNAVLVSNDTNTGYVSGWTWLGFLIVVAVASLLLFVIGLCLLIFKRRLGVALILSSVLLTVSFLMTLYVMEKVGWVYYDHLETTPEPNGRSDKLQ